MKTKRKAKRQRQNCQNVKKKSQDQTKLLWPTIKMVPEVRPVLVNPPRSTLGPNRKDTIRPVVIITFVASTIVFVFFARLSFWSSPFFCSICFRRSTRFVLTLAFCLFTTGKDRVNRSNAACCLSPNCRLAAKI